ncbi:hypothetical protein GGR45_003136 [Sphingomonas zeae]|nr:hypothetical protein [Sphingomonas zeae]
MGQKKYPTKKTTESLLSPVRDPWKNGRMVYPFFGAFCGGAYKKRTLNVFSLLTGVHYKRTSSSPLIAA